MIATTFDIAMFLSRGGDCVQGIARCPPGSSAQRFALSRSAFPLLSKCAVGSSALLAGVGFVAFKHVKRDVHPISASSPSNPLLQRFRSQDNPERTPDPALGCREERAR
jgi:hypothetical protein